MNKLFFILYFLLTIFEKTERRLKHFGDYSG